MYSVLSGKTLSGTTQRSNLVTLHTANSNNKKSHHVSAAAEPGPARHEPEGMGTLSGRSLRFGGHGATEAASEAAVHVRYRSLLPVRSVTVRRPGHAPRVSGPQCGSESAVTVTVTVIIRPRPGAAGD